MTIKTANVVASNMTMAPEIAKAMQAIELPEVRDMLRRLAEYNLGICIPHMHRPDLDFDVLPPDTVQVEDGGKGARKPLSSIRDVSQVEHLVRTS